METIKSNYRLLPIYFNQIYSFRAALQIQTVTKMNNRFMWTTVASCSVHFQLKWSSGKLTKVPSVQSASDSYYVTLEILIIALVWIGFDMQSIRDEWEKFDYRLTKCEPSSLVILNIVLKIKLHLGSDYFVISFWFRFNYWYLLFWICLMPWI